MNTKTTPEVSAPTSAHTPRNLTFAENLKLTAKVLSALGIIGLALYAAEKWTSGG